MGNIDMYENASPINCLRAAYDYLKGIYDTNTALVAVRVWSWVHSGTLIGIFIYSKVK